MKIADLGEFGLIRNIKKLSSRKDSSTLIGIGDDAAALKLSAAKAVLVTTDLLLENVHFDLSYTDYYSLGWKSAAVNLSDIAAMGGAPKYCLTALGIPRSVSAEQVLDFYRGFNALLHAHKSTLVGGDTCSSPDKFFISVTAIGEAKQSQIITRKGARPGDHVFVTGTLGDSAAGLEILKSSRRKRARGKGIEIKKMIEKHLRPVPRINEGKKLAQTGCASAMIDVSDGLSSDLYHICEQSGVGCELSADTLPISSALKKVSKSLSRDTFHYALNGGEDYELLFTVSEAKLGTLRSLRIPITEIGIITTEKKIFLTDDFGEKKTLERKGYDHFRSAVMRKKIAKEI